MVINSWCALSNVRCVLRFHMSVCRECLKNVFRTVDQVFGSYLLNSHCFKQQKTLTMACLLDYIYVSSHISWCLPQKNLRKRIPFDGSKIKHQLISGFCFPLLFLHLFLFYHFFSLVFQIPCSYQVFWVGFRGPRNPPNTFGVWKPRVCHPVDGRNLAPPGIYKASK